jgi:GNAT superfamily N-acetyltransferase
MLDQNARATDLACAPGLACAPACAPRDLVALDADRASAGDEQLEVRLFEARDRAAVLGLLRSAFGHWPRGMRSIDEEQFFDWKHRCSPFGASTLLVAEADGEVVGFLGYMPWRLRARERTVTAMRRVDLAVDGAQRRRGIAMRLRSAAVFSPDVALIWSNPNPLSRRGGAKLGQVQLERVSRFVRPARPLRVGARLAASRRDLRIEAPPAAVVLDDRTSTAHLRPAAAAPAQRLTTIADLAFLRWRYGPFDDYRAVTLPGGGGIVIFRCRRHGRFWVAHVCELLVEPGDRRGAGRLLRQVGHTAAVDFVSCNFAGPGEAARHGFAARPGKEVLMTRVLEDALAPDPRQSASWALSHGDMELL